MSGEVFFTADTHFGHESIIGMCDRPFDSIADMDRTLVEKWNARVGPGDHVFHLGDVTWKKGRRVSDILTSLNGTKTLIRGNHDHRTIRKRPEWEEVCDYKEISLEGRNIVLFHYPMMEWAGAWRGALHFYGHVHAMIPATRQHCDVGVDAWDYQPVQLAEILARLAAAPPYDPAANYGER